MATIPLPPEEFEFGLPPENDPADSYDPPDWDDPDDWNRLIPPDEPDYLADMLNTPTMPDADTVAEPAVTAERDLRAELEAELAAVSQQLEFAGSNENALERFFLQDELLEEQDALQAELDHLQASTAPGLSDEEVQGVLDALPEYEPMTFEQDLALYQLLSLEEGELDLLDFTPTAGDPAFAPENALMVVPAAEMSARPNDLNLVDARFLGRVEQAQSVELAVYTVQYIELYQDTNAQYSGQLLDIGHFDNRGIAEQQYLLVQEEAQGGLLTTRDLASIAEQVAEHNGLDPAAWREITNDDLDLYLEHGYAEADINRDTPSESVAADPLLLRGALVSAGVDPEEAARQQETLENQQAIEAMRAIGLEPPKDFDLGRDSYLDRESGDRVINGIFQQNPNDPSANCRSTFVSLSANENGMGLKAAAAEFGAVGSFEQAYSNWNSVENALQQGGLEQAMDAIERIEVQVAEQSHEPVVEAAEAVPHGWSRDID